MEKGGNDRAEWGFAEFKLKGILGQIKKIKVQTFFLCLTQMSSLTF